MSHQGNHILVDTTPEFRIQSLQNNLQQIDAVLITHTHADHIFGMDDLRRFNDLADAEIPVFGTATVLDDIRRIFNYIFMPTQPGGGKPRLTLHELEARFNLIGLSVKTLPVLHGRLPVMAFRFEDGISSFAYVTDVSQIPEDSMAQLYNLDLLILDAVRFEPHPTHFGLYQSLEVVEKLKPKQTYFTHLSHAFDHDAVNAQLPNGVELAYDGLRVLL